MIGCFLVGILIKYSSISNKELSHLINNFLIIGFCGGFTTFSAFSADSINLLNESKYFLFLSYMTKNPIQKIRHLQEGFFLYKTFLKFNLLNLNKIKQFSRRIAC